MSRKKPSDDFVPAQARSRGPRATTVAQQAMLIRDQMARKLLEAQGIQLGQGLDDQAIDVQKGQVIEVEAGTGEDWKGHFSRARSKAPVNAADPEQLPLPGVPSTPKDTAPMGNELARTPLFAPIQRGRRKIHDMTRLPSPEGISLWYFGKQLDVGDQDTYLTALMLAKGLVADTPVLINRAEFLRLMGRKCDGRTYKWLEDSFMRISTGRIFFDTPEKKGSTPLIGPLMYDRASEAYYFTIPKESLRAFGIDAYGYVDMEKRLKISHKADLAKWLQCYAISHAKGEHRVTVANLKTWSGFEGRIRQFRANLFQALDELVRVGVLQSWVSYEKDNKVKWDR